MPTSIRSEAPEYKLIDGGGFALKTVARNRVHYRQLSTFTAVITANLLHDDGQKRERHYEIKATINGTTITGIVSAEDFDRMRWGPTLLGPAAVIYPGPYAAEHVRAAIQLQSGSVPETTVYTHTGWVQIGQTWGFLHAGGIIWPDVPSANSAPRKRSGGLETNER